MIKTNFLNCIYKKNSYLNIAVFFIFTLTTQAQTHQLSGKTQDSLQNPIPNTNIIATPLMEDVQITFAISSLKGEYKLNLKENTAYQIAITHLGYKKITDTINLSIDQVKDYTLQESTETLEEILIKSEMAVIVKEDTITYRTDHFKSNKLNGFQKNPKYNNKLSNIKPIFEASKITS